MEYDGDASDFQLPIADPLLGLMGVHMAIITDSILAKELWLPALQVREPGLE
jgi:hypothetical protein